MSIPLYTIRVYQLNPGEEKEDRIEFNVYQADPNASSLDLTKVLISIDDSGYLVLADKPSQKVGPKPETHKIRLRNNSGVAGYVILTFSCDIDFYPLMPPLQKAGGGAVSINSNEIRWGYNVSPRWLYSSIISNPTANQALLNYTVSATKTGLIYGFFISTNEANIIRITWVSQGSTYFIRIPVSPGSLHTVFNVAINEGLEADSGSTISISVENSGSGQYQVGLFVAEK